MSKGLIGAIVAGVLALILVFVFMGTNNNCVRQENGLKAQYKQNQNNYANYFNKLKEAAQVPGMYTSKLEQLYKTTMEGRYGKDGSKALVQFITEQNPNLSEAMYVNLQRIIEAGRNSFEADQKALLDKKRVYENTLGEMPGSMFVSVLGFPKIDLDEYDIVINAETEDAFNTKKAGPISLQ
jgi:hypothetical protein